MQSTRRIAVNVDGFIPYGNLTSLPGVTTREDTAFLGGICHLRPGTPGARSFWATPSACRTASFGGILLAAMVVCAARLRHTFVETCDGN